MTPSLPAPSHVIADKYVVERCLGQGGMGAVYLVTHKITGKKLALKCLLPQFREHAELVQRFLREAQAAGRIQHRHVVDVFDVGSDDGVLYIVMPFLEGKSLSLILREASLDLTAILAIMLRAMEGVAAAHAQGIVHRDLKPDNIFVCVGPSGQLDDPRVLDFGISKLDDEEQRTLTQSGVLMGTPHYMSFEQLNSQRDIDARSDIYALGCILYEAISGQLPYVAESAPALAIRMLTAAPAELSALRPDLPPELARAVMKAISRERSERQQSVEELIADIAPFVAEARPTDELRLSRSLVQTEPQRERQAQRQLTGEAPTLAADTTPLRANDPAASVPTKLDVQVNTRAPRLKWVDETEGKPQAARQSSGLKRAALVGALLLGGGAAALSLLRVSGPTPSKAQKPEAPQASPSESAEAAPDAVQDDTQQPKLKRTLRKVKRKKARGTSADPASSGALPSSEAVPEGEDEEEWEEVEEEVFEPELPAKPPADDHAPAAAPTEPAPSAAEPAPSEQAPPVPAEAPSEAPSPEGAQRFAPMPDEAPRAPEALEAPSPGEARAHEAAAPTEASESR